MERFEYDASMFDDIHSKVYDVDGIPTLSIRSKGDSEEDEPINIEFPISNLSKDDTNQTEEEWAFDEGTIQINHDDRGPDGRTILITLLGPQREVLFYYVPRRVIFKLQKKLDYQIRKLSINARRARRETKKQRGRNLAAFRQTMGNLRPENAPMGAWYYGPTPNPVPEALAAEDGPGAKILEFLSGKTKGSQSVQARRLKRQSVRKRPESAAPANNLPNLAPNRGGRRTRKNRH